MHKSAVLFFTLAIGLISPSASQAPVEKIAYDICYNWDGAFGCGISVANVDGTGVVPLPMEGLQPAWSPDGSRIAFADIWGYGVYVWNPEDGSIVGLDPNYYYSYSPTWSPDGQQIAFWSMVSGPVELYAWHANGSVTQLTHQAGVIGAPAWSPDGARIAFDCEVVPGNRDICALELATSAITRLTTDLALDSEPAWSPDGARLAFETTRFGGVSEIALMNADGSAVSRLGSGIAGQLPAWSPNGNRIAFVTPGDPCSFFGPCTGFIYLVNIDGTGQTFFGYGSNVAWAASTAVFGRPHAVPSILCDGLTCAFDGTGSWDDNGQISGYTWDFGDGGSGTGGTINHTFSAAGMYSVTLTVVDNDGLQATKTLVITVVIAPHAVIAMSCSGLICTFNGSGSSDPDGTIVNYTWSFGDGAQASGPLVSHTYATVNYYTVSLRVTDNGGTSSITYSQVTVIAPLHVGDLDGTSTGLKNKWTAGATITVHDANHQPVANATVNGTWSSGLPGICTTTGAGQCTILRPLTNASSSVTFTVGGLVAQLAAYVPAANHDAEGDSNGTSITVRRR